MASAARTEAACLASLGIGPNPAPVAARSLPELLTELLTIDAKRTKAFMANDAASLDILEDEAFIAERQVVGLLRDMGLTAPMITRLGEVMP